MRGWAMYSVECTLSGSRLRSTVLPLLFLRGYYCLCVHGSTSPPFFLHLCQCHSCPWACLQDKLLFRPGYLDTAVRMCNTFQNDTNFAHCRMPEKKFSVIKISFHFREFSSKVGVFLPCLAAGTFWCRLLWSVYHVRFLLNWILNCNMIFFFFLQVFRVSEKPVWQGIQWGSEILRLLYHKPEVG